MEEIRFFDGAWVVWDVLAGAPRATQPDDVFAEALPIIVNADTPALTLNGGSGADADDFTIADGVISWKTPPTPGQPSASGDNIFDITAIVSDDENLQDMIDLSITLM